MIHSISMKFFRKHEDRTITFGPGLNVVRGVNEKGKSSVYESMLYALYGSKALRNSLSDTVTWGHKESELKVELTLEVSGRLYSFTRGKSGAECNYDGGIVTGQNEVSNFAAELLGADVNTANKLMLANQNNLRGALEEGPKAVSQQIETLADFDLFDRIFAAAEQKLLTGSTAMMEDRCRAAQIAVDAARVEPLDIAPLDETIQKLAADVCDLQNQAAALQPMKEAATAAFVAAEAQANMRTMLQKNVDMATGTMNEHVVQKAAADTAASGRVEAGGIQKAKDQITAAETHSLRRGIFVAMEQLRKGYPESFWEGSKEEFEAELVSEEAVRDGYLDQINQKKFRIAAIDHEIRAIQAKIITSTTCPSCGSELKDKVRIETSNNEFRAQIADLTDERLTLYATLAGIETARDHKHGDIQALKSVRQASAPYERFASTHGQHVDVDLGTYPPQFKWRGDVPEETCANVDELKKWLISLQTQEGVAERGAARSIALTTTLEEDEANIKRLRAQLAECADPGDVNALQTAKWDVENKQFHLEQSVKAIGVELAAAESKRAIVVAENATRVARAADAAEKLKQAEADLDGLVFNNALLRKIRLARPEIGNKLWSLVLASVSTMFSHMRGEASSVTKDASGFKVNGESVTSLSGSTLDLLGLSIRCSLVRTFLPNCNLLVLDEPGHGMDSDRSASMMGFLKGLGFGQTLLVSHDPDSVAVADHLVEL